MESPHSQDQIHEANFVVWIHTVITLILVPLRLWHRVFVQRKLGWDDNMLAMATLPLFVNAIMITEWVSLSYHPTRHPVLIGSVLGTSNSLTLVFGMASLAFMLNRLTPRCWKISMWCSLLVTSGLVYFQALSFWFQDCSAPVSEPFRLSGGCVSTEFVVTYRILVQAVLCAMDILLAAIMVKTKWVLQLNLRTGLLFGLALGTCMGAAFTSISRLIDLANHASEYHDYVPSWEAYSFVRNILEPAYTVIAVAVFPTWQKAIVDTGGRNQDMISASPMTASHEKTTKTRSESINEVVETTLSGSTVPDQGPKMEAGRAKASGNEKESPKSRFRWIGLPIAVW